jgi:hypothetical protein
VKGTFAAFGRKSARTSNGIEKKDSQSFAALDENLPVLPTQTQN